MLDLGPLLIAGLAVLLGAVVQGTVGFGAALIAAPVIAMLDPTLMPAALLIVTVSLPVLSVLRERQAADWQGLRWSLLGRAPGTAVGALAVTRLPADMLALGVTVMVLAAVGLSLSTWRPTTTPPTLLTAGFISGVTGTATSIGGPPMALVYQHEQGARLRSTLGLNFVVGATFSLISLVVTGSITRYQVFTGLALLPFLIVGFLVSGPLRRVIDGPYTRPAVLVVAAASALVLGIRTLL